MGYLAAALVLLVADQWSKLWTVATFSAPAAGSIATADPYREFLPGLIELTRLHNYGAAWGSLAGMRVILVGISTLILVAVMVVAAKRIVRHPLGKTALCLLFAGGLGNLIDRVRLGYVVDMLHFEFWPSYPVFNVADICVVLGTILGAVYYMWYYETYDAPKKEEPDGTDPSDGIA